VVYAAGRADLLLEEDDPEGAAVWRAIVGAIKDEVTSASRNVSVRKRCLVTHPWLRRALSLAGQAEIAPANSPRPDHSANVIDRRDVGQDPSGQDASARTWQRFPRSQARLQNSDLRASKLHRHA